MKKLTGLLFIGLCACTGCLGEQKYPMSMSLPGMTYFGKSPPIAPEAVAKPASPKPVTPEEVNPASAKRTADALRQELDRAETGEP